MKTQEEKTYEILHEVADERADQNTKWGKQQHCPKSWLMILGEEVGEANKAVLEACNFENGRLVSINREKLKGFKGAYREELVQVAAVAVAMIECLDEDQW